MKQFVTLLKSVAANLKFVAVRLVEALNKASEMIPEFVVPMVKEIEDEAAAFMRILDQLEKEPTNGSIDRIKMARSRAIDHLNTVEAVLAQEFKFLTSLWLSDELYIRINRLPNGVGEPVLAAWQDFDQERQDPKTPLEERRRAYLMLRTSIEQAEARAVVARIAETLTPRPSKRRKTRRYVAKGEKRVVEPKKEKKGGKGKKKNAKAA